jgi:hypothetical protein
MMPQQPDPNCQYCGGTGRMKPEYLGLLDAQDHPPCICTITTQELIERPDTVIREVRGVDHR